MSTDRQVDGLTDRVSTSVSHFAGIYCICSKVPRLIMMVRQKSHPRPGPPSVRGSRVSALPALLLSFIQPIATEGGQTGATVGKGEKKLTELPSDVSLPGNSCTSVERLRRRIQMRRPHTGGARKADSFIYIFVFLFPYSAPLRKEGHLPHSPITNGAPTS